MERLPGDPRAWSNSSTMDPRVACAECQSWTHEAEDCPHRKQRETNIANRAKHFQTKVDKLVREGLCSRVQPSRVQPTVMQPTVIPKAAHDNVDTIDQMQPPSSSMSGEEKVCLSNVVEQYRIVLSCCVKQHPIMKSFTYRCAEGWGQMS